MSSRMIRTKSIRAVSDDGESFEIHEYREMFSANNTEVKGRVRYLSSKGERATRNKDGTFKIYVGDECVNAVAIDETSF